MHTLQPTLPTVNHYRFHGMVLFYYLLLLSETKPLQLLRNINFNILISFSKVPQRNKSFILILKNIFNNVRSMKVNKLSLFFII